ALSHGEALGFSRQRLRGRNWRRIGCGPSAWAGIELDPHSELLALHCRLPPGCVFSGLTAARLHGMDTDGSSAVEVTVPTGVSVRARPSLRIQTTGLDLSAMTKCGTLPVTTPLRTCFDLARSLPLVDAVVVLDSAVHRKLVTLHELREYVGRRSRLPRI